ncbi:MAG: NAD(P)-dependent oxidoreductase, partial [Acidobacteriota bacterium]
VGCGNIGAIVANRAQGLKMRVIAYDPFVSPERAAELNPTIALIPIIASQIELEGARWLAEHEAGRAGPLFAESINQAERAIEAQEGYPLTHLCLARARFWRARWRHEGGRNPQADLEAALASADRALELQANDAEAHAVRARVFALQATLGGGGEASAANLERARAELARAIELLPTLRQDLADLIDVIGLPEERPSAGA